MRCDDTECRESKDQTARMQQKREEAVLSKKTLTDFIQTTKKHLFGHFAEPFFMLAASACAFD